MDRHQCITDTPIEITPKDIEDAMDRMRKAAPRKCAPPIFIEDMAGPRNDAVFYPHYVPSKVRLRYILAGAHPSWFVKIESDYDTPWPVTVALAETSPRMSDLIAELRRLTG